MTAAAPQLPTSLPEARLPVLGPAEAIETVHLRTPAWSGQTARRVTIDTTRLTAADLTAASLRDSGWVDVLIEGGEFSGLDLAGSTWRRVQAGAGRFSGLLIIEGFLRDVTFTGAKLDLANFRGATLTHVVFKDCDLSEADFAGARLTNVSFGGSQLNRVGFAGATCRQVDLRGAQVTDPTGLDGLAGATVSGVQLIALAPALATTIGLKIETDGSPMGR